MKVKTILFSFIIIIGLVSINLTQAQSQEKEKFDKDNLGKVVVQVVDPNTLKPVNEVFRVNFFNSLDWQSLETNILEWYEKTNNKGYAVAKLKPGIYYMQFLPESSESKYAFDPSPVFSDKDRQIIAVESQKITEVLKKAKYGSKLKIILTDPSGNKINPRKVFSADINIKTTITSEVGLGTFSMTAMTDSELTDFKDDLNDGELTIGRLFPGKYIVTINFGAVGYKSIRLKDIEVLKNQTKIKEVIVDINDSTGIEGIITDQTGKPLKNVYVRCDGARSKTNQNGYYRIVGIDEGRQFIRIYTLSFERPKYYINESHMIEIIKNQIIRKDYIIEIK